MTTNIAYSPFHPDYAIPPGESLLELLDEKGLSQADLAERTGRPKKTINEIVKGKAAITPETALQFERVLGMPASYWVSLEQLYRSALARQEEKKRLEKHVSWLTKFPIAEMIKRGWLQDRTDKVELLQQLLTFFGVASPDAWEDVWSSGKEAAAFRRQESKSTNRHLLATWLRQGEVFGKNIECEPFDVSRFKDALSEVRGWTSHGDIQKSTNAMQAACAKAGVAVVFVPEFPRLGVFGATRWLSQDKALIQLSLHYKRADQFWFSFFHEAGHILLHGKREIFVEEKGLVDREEDEANKFAEDFLISPQLYKKFLEVDDFSKAAILDFAAQLKIAPNIVVGRLQREKKIGFHEGHDLIVWLQWVRT